MSSLNILVVEDESIIAKDIESSLLKLGYRVVGICSRGEDAVKMVSEQTIDLILMDIMLKGDISGIETAKRINETFDIPIIYLTAYADESTLSNAKMTEPYGYILKPFKEIDLHTAIEMAVYKHKKVLDIKRERDLLYSIVENQEQGTSKDFLFVKAGSRIVKIKMSDVFFVEALKDYVVINLVNVRYTVHSTMKDIEKKLAGNQFIRVHRSFIVRLDKIVAVENHNLILESDKKAIPIGGSYKDDLVRRINIV
jgi:DNA-binding LytR/AlgR family response regulator